MNRAQCVNIRVNLIDVIELLCETDSFQKYLDQ